MENLKNQFNEIESMKLFEFKVLNNKTNEEDYIIFDIYIEDNRLIATHESLNSEQSKSNEIAFVSIELDNIFCLDENLQSLYEECANAILNSEFFSSIED